MKYLIGWWVLYYNLILMLNASSVSFNFKRLVLYFTNTQFMPPFQCEIRHYSFLYFNKQFFNWNCRIPYHISIVADAETGYCFCELSTYLFQLIDIPAKWMRINIRTLLWWRSKFLWWYLQFQMVYQRLKNWLSCNCRLQRIYVPTTLLPSKTCSSIGLNEFLLDETYYFSCVQCTCKLWSWGKILEYYSQYNVVKEKINFICSCYVMSIPLFPVPLCGLYWYCIT